MDFYYLSLNSENKKLDFKEFDLYIYRVFNILSVIESTPYIDENESKERYAEILIFGLTQHELRVIFYYFSILFSFSENITFLKLFIKQWK